jgi:hypothetical protein
MNKKCVISNYIPYKTPKKLNYSKWYNAYKEDLYLMFKIVENILNINYENSYNIDYNDFCLLIYNSSSKYIRKEFKE